MKKRRNDIGRVIGILNQTRGHRALVENADHERETARARARTREQKQHARRWQIINNVDEYETRFNALRCDIEARKRYLDVLGLHLRFEQQLQLLLSSFDHAWQDKYKQLQMQTAIVADARRLWRLGESALNELNMIEHFMRGGNND